MTSHYRSKSLKFGKMGDFTDLQSIRRPKLWNILEIWEFTSYDSLWIYPICWKPQCTKFHDSFVNRFWKNNVMSLRSQSFVISLNAYNPDSYSRTILVFPYYEFYHLAVQTAEKDQIWIFCYDSLRKCHFYYENDRDHWDGRDNFDLHSHLFALFAINFDDFHRSDCGNVPCIPPVAKLRHCLARSGPRAVNCPGVLAANTRSFRIRSRDRQRPKSTWFFITQEKRTKYNWQF